jgi:hypothetical protein
VYYLSGNFKIKYSSCNFASKLSLGKTSELLYSSVVKTGSWQTELAMPYVSQMANKHFDKCSKIGRTKKCDFNWIVYLVIFLSQYDSIKVSNMTANSLIFINTKTEYL